ncbi:N-acetylated-alpha-linked acidic dipeptidase, partial [Phenoliferia sp. Uapishka_3]
VTHVAGTEGDRLSALRVKSQWEQLLGLRISAPDENVLESGTKESQEALMGKKCSGGKGHWRFSKRWWWKKLGLSSGHAPWEVKKPTVWVDTYHPLLNYPVSHSLTLTPPGATEPSFIASLLEDSIPEDTTSAEGRFDVPTFHGLSFSGSAEGKLVYAGRGNREEFQALVDKGVDLKGKIVIVQYGGAFRGLKVKNAGEFGAAGCIVYTDPAEDGEVTAENGYEVYPNGPARQPSSVQRGSVQYLSIYPGDPLTPFTPAYKNATNRLPRDDPSINMPTIPSFPISYQDALPLLKSLNGKGYQMRDASKGKEWKEGGLGYLGVEYWSGPGEDTIKMENIMDDKVTPIWNTMAVIPGRLSDEVVVVGNHNDAWTFGAGDPNSGTASVHEVVKALGVLLEQGWKPLRTIVLASWDAEEYGLIGSTEFGEDFSAWLKENVVAYLNVDVSVAGTSYGVGASPSLADLFKDISNVVIDPDQPNRTLLAKMMDEGSEDDWAGHGHGSEELKIGPLGSGSDFTVFLQHLTGWQGIASVNVGFSRKRTDPVYHYHSIYDSAYWMDKFGDSTFKRHVAISQVMGLATLRFADSLILPINITGTLSSAEFILLILESQLPNSYKAYATELSYYVSKVRSLPSFTSSTEDEIQLSSLDDAVSLVKAAAASLDAEIEAVTSALAVFSSAEDHKHKPCLHKLMKKVRSINKRLQQFEGGFITEEGLPQRPWYRSRAVAPGRYLGYGATTLPALTESLTLDHNTTEAKLEVKKLVEIFEVVAKGLEA